MNIDEKIISRIKFIGKIPKNSKINIRSMILEPNTIILAIKRTFYDPDSRENTLDFCCTNIRLGFDILQKLLASEKEYERELGISLIKDINSAEEGLNNIKYTYTSDIMFGCSIDTFIQDMRSRIKAICEKYKITLNTSDSANINDIKSVET